MELDRFVRMLGRYWVLVVLLGTMGALGTFVYHQTIGGGGWAGASTATTSVAVSEPAITRSSTGQQALINFASVAESIAVAERVNQRLGLDTRPDVPPARVSVRLARTLVTAAPTPLYYIQVQHRDPEWALKIAEAYVEEARDLFIELNALDPTQVDAALQGEEDRIRADLAQSRAALRAFEEKNDAWRLSSQVDAQVALVNSLRSTARTSDLGAVNVSAARSDAERNLARAQTELTRLRGLQPEYERLSLEVTLATTTLSQLTSREADLALGTDTTALNAVRSEITSARARLSRARDALTAFQQANGSVDLPTEIANRTATVTELRRQIAGSDGGLRGLDDLITTEEAELRRMRALLPEYEQLALPVLTGEAKLSQLQLRKTDMVIAGSLPSAVLVKVLDTPHVGGNWSGAILLYFFGTMFGVFVGLALVYLIGYFDRTPESAAQVEELVGIPVLVRLSKAR